MSAVRPRFLGLACCIAVLWGCGDGPSGPERFDPVGTLQFTYRGPISGTFEATGEMQVQPGTLPQPVTGATAYRQENALSLLAFRVKTPSRGDLFAVHVGEAGQPGTIQLDPLSCQQQSLAGCRVGIFLPDVDATALADSTDLRALAERGYVLLLGSVTITSRTDLRVRGTFQGIAFRGGEQSLQNALTISNGRFDLPIRPE